MITTLYVFLLTFNITFISSADIPEFFKTRCNSSCTFLKERIAHEYVASLPFYRCDRLCAHVVIDENTDLTEKQLTGLFHDIKTLYGSLTISNTKLTSGKFLTSLETIECEPDGSFIWENNELMTEIGMTNLTRCHCQFYVNGNTKMSNLNLPKLEYFSPSNKTNQQEVEMIIYNMAPDFCLSIEEMTKFIKNENLYMSNIPETFCRVNSTLIPGSRVCEFNENSIMQLMPDDCTIVVGNMRVEDGDEGFVYKLKSMKYLFGTFVLFHTNLTSFELTNLEYVVSLLKGYDIVAVRIQINYDLTKFSMPNLKRVRAAQKIWIEFDNGNKKLFNSLIHEKTICNSYMDIKNETELYYASMNGWHCEMCDECEDYGLAADLLSFSPASKYHLPEKYFSILEKGWSSSIASYTGDNSIEECINEVKKYACFPGSHIYFDMALADPLPTMFHKHHNLKNNEMYIYKQDIMKVLQLTVNNLKCDHGYDLHVQQTLFVNSVIGFFLKSVGLFFLQGIFELVPYPETLFLKFSEQLEEIVENTKSIHRLTDKTSCNEIIEKLEKILLLNKKSPESECLLKMVENCGVQPSNLEFFERCLDRTSVIIGEINRFMNSNKKLVLPEKVGSNFIPTVRVFDDGNNAKFVLVHELLTAMFVDRNNDKFEFVHGILREMMAAKLGTFGIEAQTNMPELWTEDFETIQHILGDDFDKITFVQCKIVNTSRRAYFIPSINGKYCFKTSNAILEIIGDMITAHGYLQNLNTTHWDMLSPLLHELANRFEQESNGCQIIETQAAYKIKKWMMEETAKVFACRPKKTKEIRTIRDDWFTAKDVKNELKRLGITESFAPEIPSDLIRDAYKHVTYTIDGCVPPTRCFYEIMEMIQVALILKKFEKIWHLFHVCGDCNCILFNCIFCDGSASFSENQPQILADEKAEKRKEKKKRQAEKKRIAKEERGAVENVAPGDCVPEVVEASPAATAPTLVSVVLGSDLTAGATQQQPTLDHAISQETVSEGVNQPRIEQKNVLNSCSKCYRTSQHCEKVKTQLKEEKIKTKALNKKVVELSETVVKKDEKISEKDEEIRLLKEKLAAMEASLQKPATKSFDEPPTSNQVEEEDEQPVRYLTPTYKNSEFSAETRAKFNELLNIRDSHTRLERQAKQRARALTNKSKDFGIKRMASRELVQILKSYEAYFQVVEDNIKWIQKHKNNHLDKLTTLPELPKFSDNFETTYDEVVNEELSDKQCPVCIEEIEDLSGTIKCKCKKRYHVHCAWDMDVKGYKCYCKERLPLD